MDKNSDLSQAIATLENQRADPLPAVAALLAQRSSAAQPLLTRLDSIKLGWRIPSTLERLQGQLSNRLKAQSLFARRIVVALGALQAVDSVPALLRLLANSPFDQRLSQAASWALANIGEASVMPLFLFARCCDLLAHARSLAILSLGYIADPRVPSILHFLWREVRMETPGLAIASLMGLVMREGFESAHKLALETEQLWRFQGSGEEQLNKYWLNLKFTSSIDPMHAALERVRSAGRLPGWAEVLSSLEPRP